MGFWSNDEFAGENEPGRKRRMTMFNGGYTWRRKVLLIISPILLLTVGWLLIELLLLDHTNSDGIGQTTTSENGTSSFNENVILATNHVKETVVSVVSSVQQGEVKGKQARDEEVLGVGSGIIFRIEGKKALVVTSQQVIEGATELEIVLTNGERRKAKLVGADQVSDLAVLEMDSEDIQSVAKLGDSERLKAGDSVIAIGNPLGLGYSQTMTAGIISLPLRKVQVSLNRDGQVDWEVELIQTDAAIDEGNNGGALVNLDGAVIGINSLKESDLGVEGLGFAIPSNQAKPIIESLMKFGKVKRPFIGVSTTDLSALEDGTESLKLPDDVKSGIVVLEATGPAGEAGLLTGDLIVQLDHQVINTTLELRKYLYYEKKIGDQVEVGFYREHKRESAVMTLAELGAVE